MACTLGTVTIGQSPRVDLIPEMKSIIGGEIDVIEAGALDGLSLDEVELLRPEAGDYVLVTRMADGTAVKIAEKHIVPRMQDAIDGLVRRGAQTIALVCTGEFPHFDCERLIVRPQRVLFNVASSVAAGLRLGVILPDGDQIPQARNRWAAAGSELRFEPASPYGPVECVELAAGNLSRWGAQVVVMDCMGYTLAMKEMVRRITGRPVILARSILARVLAELI